jgi:predicted transcriptional regulator of viral defense system
MNADERSFRDSPTRKHSNVFARRVNLVPSWQHIDMYNGRCHNRIVRTRFDEMLALAEENDGILTTKQAREAGIAGSVLARLAQRGRLERAARGVYRIPYFPSNRLSQYREAVLWARAGGGPRDVALSHATALVVYGISDASPSLVHLTVPRKARLRRVRPKWVRVHRVDLARGERTVHEGLPITTVARTVEDTLTSSGRVSLVKQAISDARREGFINRAEAQRLRRRVARYVRTIEAGKAASG